MKQKRRFIVILVLVLFCFVLQSTILHSFALGSITPNLLIVITSSIGFMRGKKEGMITGFVAGLLIDLFFGTYIGFQAFIYMVIGYCNGYFQRLFYDEDIKLPLVLISCSQFTYGLCIFVTGFLLQAKFDFYYYLINIILPELVYTLLATLVLYKVVRKLNHWLENSEKRSTNNFV